uniref:Uncharacterized protein n=1 Tax=Rhizophora mucronata TaxID=61149 RepID=A0A2P2PC68_RHIMU
MVITRKSRRRSRRIQTSLRFSTKMRVSRKF